MATEDNKEVIISLSTTFLLRGVDIKEVIKEYTEGGYADIPMPEKISIKIINSLSVVPRYTQSKNTEIYFYFDRGNNRQVVHTVNHEKYEAVLKAYNENLPLEIPPGGICQWCRGDIDENPIGIPIKLEKVYLEGHYKPSILVSQSMEKFIYVAYLDSPSFCSFNCAKAYLEFEKKLQLCNQDPLHSDSEDYLNIIYRILYPDDPPLRAAPDWRLKRGNFGSIDDKEYYENRYLYIRTNNVVFLPIKVEYLQQQFDN